jgi:hypothetical protein
LAKESNRAKERATILAKDHHLTIRARSPPWLKLTEQVLKAVLGARRLSHQYRRSAEIRVK